MTLAANADIDALSAFTVRIFAIHLRLNASFIDIYELFFGNVFDFFSKYASTCLRSCSL